jgi:hypothetical protein
LKGSFEEILILNLFLILILLASVGCVLRASFKYALLEKKFTHQKRGKGRIGIIGVGIIGIPKQSFNAINLSQGEHIGLLHTKT